MTTRGKTAYLAAGGKKASVPFFRFEFLRNKNSRHLFQPPSMAALAALLCAGLLLLGGCKDLFHPGGPNKQNNQEQPGIFTVSFDADGGSPAAQTRTVDSGASVGASNMPSEPSKSGYSFGGWYTEMSGGGTQFTATTTVTGDITVYARWTSQYTVTFNADGGTPAAQTRTVDSGALVGASNMPSEPSKSGYSFGGWYTAVNGGGTPFAATTTVTGDITVYARWTVPILTTSLQAALDWLDVNATEGGMYTITVNANETIAPKTLSYSGKNVSITLNGGTSERTVSLSAKGSLFTLGSGVTLILDSNITLQGRNDNTASLVRVNSGGTLMMNTGSKISGNVGGGVYVSGTYTMSGGTISGNTTFDSDSGAGVSVVSGTFTMSGGTISGNTTSAYAGGVYVYSGTFTMFGGTISGNTASSYYGGGVFVFGEGTFTMSGGTISGNSSFLAGGGLYIYDGGTFTMSGGTISGNTATAGGGVFVNSGTFIKQSDGIIYGSNADSTLKNTATNYGHAVFVNSTPSKKRDTTAGVGVTLNSATSGSAGGWE